MKRAAWGAPAAAAAAGTLNFDLALHGRSSSGTRRSVLAAKVVALASGCGCLELAQQLLAQLASLDALALQAPLLAPPA